ncbi:MAG: D-alanine--D-alanine ligase [Alphaproteobacteria bacterium]|nr:D-alanine--D-alanine ligase [Alphaproteobacteria bacterium]
MAQTKNNKTVKKTVAVFYGGRSPEHDISIISALQVLQAFDTSKFDIIPVYIAPDGAWYTGDILRERDNFLLDAQGMENVTEVTLDIKADRGGKLLPKKKGLFGAVKPIEFDIAMLIFHGLYGEDGNIQGLFELANVPYTGMRTKASAILMDKVTTKFVLHSLDIPVLPYTVVRRPDDGSYLVDEKSLEELFKPLGFPCILKPVHLGSSIGVAKVNSIEEVKACLPAIFEYDDSAIAEPFVENLVEYNVAVGRINGEIKISAIERPKTTTELLDFKQKYVPSNDGEGGIKSGGVKNSPIPSEGMLSLTRDINPDIPEEMERDIRSWSTHLFDVLDGTGIPRIDFIGNSKTGEIWMNEVNPCPGSFGFFLWEAAKDNPVLFTDLLTMLIEEAISENARHTLPYDPVPQEARLLRRP